MKPRLRYSEVFTLPDFAQMKHEETKLLLDGQPCLYAGDNGSLVWLKFGRKVRTYRRDSLRGHLKLP